MLCSASASAQSVERDSTFLSFFEKEIELIATDTGLQHQLPDSLLVPASEKVVLDSLVLRHRIDYEISYLHGYLDLLRPVAAGRILHVRYNIFPFGLSTSYAHRQSVRAKSAAAKIGSERAAEFQRNSNPVRRVLPSSRLKQSGSIVRGVSVGSNQNLQVDSGLRLQVSGHLSENVEVIASLTDQNTPIQPEGNTQTLQEIDKVFVQVKGPKMKATLGDYTLNLTGGQFTNYQRKLEGVMAEGNFERGDFKMSAAVSRGKFVSNRFSGREGNQGPYQLTGENGNINIIVLAGTEKIWIDGELLTRGENHDYIIEYGNGQVTFTRNRLITQDSRIVVDFQFSDESFQRNYLVAQGETRFANNKIQLQTIFIRESDDKNNPLSLNLTGEALNVLASAGDSLAVIRGDTLLAAGKGAYIKEPDGVFVFVGPGNGNYNVSFSFFGSGKGDYRNIGLGQFEFAGKNQGDYLPFILLPAAQQHDMLGLNFRAAPTSYLNLKSEIAFSKLDRNLYSSRNDGDNGGAAYQFQIELRPDSVKLGDVNLGKFNFAGKLRHKAAEFRDITRATIAEFARRWNLPVAPALTSEDILELQAGYFPVKGMMFRGGIGRLQKSTTFQANRWELATALKRARLPNLSYLIEFIDRDDNNGGGASEWLRQKGRLDYEVKKFKPLVEFEAEVKKDARADSSQSGFRFESFTAGMAFSPWRSLTTSARFNFRNDKERMENRFFDKSTAATQTYSLNLKKWQALNVNASYVHRQRDFKNTEVQDTRTDLADLRIGYRPASGWLRSNAYYQISNTQIARQQEVFIEVADGDGNFRFNEDQNEFEPDPLGNFVRRLFATNQFVPVVELKFRADMSLAPARFFSKKSGSHKLPALLRKLMTPVTSESFLRIDERTKEKDVKKIYLLRLGSFQQDSTTIFGSIEFRQDLYLWKNNRKMSLRYRYRNRTELNNQFVGGGQERALREQELRGLYQFSRHVSAQIEYGYSEEDRLFKSPLREDRQIRSHEVQTDLVYRPQGQLELATKAIFSVNKDIFPDPATRAQLLSLKPRAVYSLSNKGRLQAEIDWTRVTVAPKTRLIPFELTDGRRAGISFRWNVGLEYRVSQYVRATFSYFGRSDPDRPKTQHVAKLEMRAFF